MNPLLLTDGYKTGHHQQYPKGTTLVYSNFTPRSNRYAPKGCDEVVVFGPQMVMKQLHEMFQNEFFSKPKAEVCSEMKRELSAYLGTDYGVSHFEALHDLGHLPIAVKSLPEGTKAPIKVPVLTIYNTHPDFYWLTNYLETILSNLLWKPMTSATIAHQYRKVLTQWMEKTDKERAWFVDWQGHDFSMRGMDSVEAVISSGLGHLTSFSGSDSLPAIHGARKFYGASEFVAGSVPATEHSVMCAGGKEDEVDTFRRLLETYPSGILSVVSDTWDLWKVCTKHVVTLKKEILARDGKLVIRPDSGDPVDILCGSIRFDNKEEYETEKADGTLSKANPSEKGVIELLWDIFGGTVNEQGYKLLDSHIGAIYGDSITLERQIEIYERLAAKGFASTNIVLGVGSFTYQFNTRDTLGFAAKGAWFESDTETYDIYKDPITDDGTKKSLKGLIMVDENYEVHTQCTPEQEAAGMLRTIYEDGKFYNQTSLTEIREKLKNSI